MYFLVSLLLFAFNSCTLERDNPLDPESPSYNSSDSSYSTISGPKYPSPSDGSAISDATPLLNWEDVSGASGYHIQVSTSNSFTYDVIVDNSSLTASQYQVISPLSNNTTYYWRVRVKNADGVWGDWSSTWSFTVDITLQVPANPSPPSGSSIIDTTPLLDWEDIIGVETYHIQVSTDSTFDIVDTVNDDTIIQSEYQISTLLSNNITYYWRVRVKNEDGIWGDWCSTWDFTVDIEPPANPVSPLDGNLIIDTTPLLDWEDIIGATTYHIQVSTGLDFGVTIVDNDILTESKYQIITTLTDKTTYYWRVKIKNEDGVWGDWSSTWSFTIVDYFAKSYGGNGSEGARVIQETSDGGFVVAGVTNSFGAGNYDWWILKLKNDGSIIWQKAYGGTDADHVYSIHETSNGGYIVAGWTMSFGAGYVDAWVLKLDRDGSIVWQKGYGGNDYDEVRSIQETSDGGFIMAGRTTSFGALDFDAWIVKLNNDGTIAWQKRFDGGGSDYINSIQQTTDGGFIATGFYGHISGGLWIIKLNSNGTIIWQKTYGITSDEYASEEGYSIQQTSDGGFIVSGSIDLTGTGQYYDYWVLKLNSDGTIVWQKAYQYNKNLSPWRTAYSIQEVSGGGFIVAGSTDESGTYYSWILRLNNNGSIVWQKSYGENNCIYSIQETSDGGFISAGEIIPNLWILKLNSDGICTPLDSDTSTTPIDTFAVSSSLSVNVSDTNATVTSTNTIITNTNAIIYQQAP